MYYIEDLAVFPINKEIEQLKSRYEKMIDNGSYIVKESQIEEIDQLLFLFREMKMSFNDWERMKRLATINREYRLGEINNGKLEKRNFVLDL